MNRRIQYVASDRRQGMTAREIQAAANDMVDLGLDLNEYYAVVKLATWSTSKIQSIEFVKLETE